jgi:glutathione peroxidase
MTDFYSLSAKSMSGEVISMSEYKGKVVLVVNTASACGFTYQYDGLQELYDKYKEQGFVILGFPCNQFGAQEKGSSDEIQSFCRLNFGVNFPLFEKIDVNGADTHPIFDWLKSQKAGVLGSKKIKWNFTKFLINKDGQVVERFGSITKPEKMSNQIEALL